MTQAAEQEPTPEEPLFHDMDGKPVHIGDSVELVSGVVEDCKGEVITVHRANTPANDMEAVFLAMSGKSIDDFFISDSREPGLAFPCNGVRKVEA